MKEKLKVSEIKLINQIKNLDINKDLKDVLLLFLNQIIAKSLDTDKLIILINKLFYISIELDIYYLSQEHKIIEHVIYLLVKEILRDDTSRKLFYQEIKRELEKEPHEMILIGLLEHFMFNTSEIELNQLLGIHLQEFHLVFFQVVMVDALEHYHECDMWEKVGESISGLIKNKIEICVEIDNINGLYEIFSHDFFNCLNVDDLVFIFSYDKLNLINFLRKSDYDNGRYEAWWWGFRFKNRDNEIIMNIIRKAMIKSFEEFEVKTYDPVFSFKLISLLSFEDFNLIENNPNIRFFRILMLYKEFLETGRSGTEYFKKFLKTKSINLTRTIIQVIKRKNLRDLFLFWDNFCWDVLDISEIKELLDNKEINLVESLLKSAFYYAETRIVEMVYYFPKKLKKNLGSQIKQHVISIIEKDEKDLFTAILAMRLLDFFSTEELLSLIDDKQLNLLEKIDKALENSSDKIYVLNEVFYQWQIKFIKFLSRFNISISQILMSIITRDDEEIWEEDYLDEEQFQLEEWVMIADKTIRLKNYVLDLSELNIYDLNSISGLFNLKTIKVLSLSKNYFEELPKEIGNLTTLEKIIIEECNISSLPNSVGNLQNLKYLNLQSCNIKSIPISLGNLKKLEVLNISSNRIHKLPDTIGKLKSLRELHVNYNPDILLPDSIKNLKNLEILNIKNNKMKLLPDNFSELESIKELDISRNSIILLPDWVRNWKKLENLNLSYNENLKEIPDSIGELGSLQIFNLSRTGLIKLPYSIGNLKKLEDLDLDYTNIKELPESIGNLGLLDQLNVYHHGGIVKIPESLINCTSLSYLKINDSTKKEYAKFLTQLKRNSVRRGGWALRVM